MTVRTVGSTAAFDTIDDAMSVANPGDTIELEAGYSGETAVVTKTGLTLDADASSVGIELQLAVGVAAFSLIGDGDVSVIDAVDGNAIFGNAGNNLITVTNGADAVDGGLGAHDRLFVDYRLATGAVTGTAASVSEAGGSRLVTITEGTIEHFTILTGGGADTITTGGGDDIIDTGDGAGTITAGQGYNRITGGSGVDTITVLDGGNLIEAGDGDNIITSGSGVDRISTGSGADTVSAGANNDLITVRGGSDTIHGEAGADRLTVDYAASVTVVTMAAPTGSLAGYTGSVADLSANTVSFDGIEHFTVMGGSTGDSLTAAAGADVLSGRGGDDMLSGGAGGDRLTGGGGDDRLFGGLGNDVLEGGAGNDAIAGGFGFDTVTYFSAGGGVVVNLALSTAQDTGGAGVDTLIGVEHANGSDGFADTLFGNGIRNVINGFGGDDTIRGGGGNDDLIGWFGDDLLDGGAGADKLTGGSGVDTATYYYSAAGVTVSLALGTAQDTVGAGVDTLTTIENLNGSTYADRLTGGGGPNMINGYGGNDRIQGGNGADVLIGGLGADTFVFTALTDSDGGALDRIADLGGSDIVDLSAIDANGSGFGNGSFARIANGGDFDMAGQMRLSQHGGDTWLELNTDADATAEMTILLTGNHTGAGAQDGWLL